MQCVAKALLKSFNSLFPLFSWNISLALGAEGAASCPSLLPVHHCLGLLLCHRSDLQAQIGPWLSLAELFWDTNTRFPITHSSPVVCLIDVSSALCAANAERQALSLHELSVQLSLPDRARLTAPGNLI